MFDRLLDLQPGGPAGHDGVAVVARAGLFKSCQRQFTSLRK